MRPSPGRAAEARGWAARQTETALPAPHDRQPPPLPGGTQPPGPSAQLPPAPPGEVWQADLTDVATKEGWLYVAGVLAACRRKIVGWAADGARPTSLAARAFERAIAAQRPESGLLHHSERGSQHASDASRTPWRRHGVVPGMSRSGNCYDHAKMQSFWAPRKTELIDGQGYATRAEARSAFFRYIEVFYNRARLHGALGYTAPVDFEHNLN